MLNEIRREGYDDGIHGRPYSDVSYHFKIEAHAIYREAYKEGKRDAETLAADDLLRARDEKHREMRERGEL